MTQPRTPTSPTVASSPPAATAVAFTTTRADSDQPVLDLSAAPLPTAATLRRRRSLPAQAVRFVGFSARIMRMVAAGHH